MVQSQEAVTLALGEIRTDKFERSTTDVLYIMFDLHLLQDHIAVESPARVCITPADMHQSSKSQAISIQPSPAVVTLFVQPIFKLPLSSMCTRASLFSSSLLHALLKLSAVTLSSCSSLRSLKLFRTCETHRQGQGLFKARLIEQGQLFDCFG